MIKYTEEFKREAVRIALTSGLPRDPVAKTLGRWLSHYPAASAPGNDPSGIKLACRTELKRQAPHQFTFMHKSQLLHK